MAGSTPISPRDRDAILQSLNAGVTPWRGLQHIQVARALETASLVRSAKSVADGGSAFRILVGRFGSGKTFQMFLARAIALECRLVTMHADLSPTRLLQGKGKARGLYQELIRNLATRSKPEGGALASIVERFIDSAREEAKSRNVHVEDVLGERLKCLEEMPGGYEFATVIAAYWRGLEEGDEAENEARIMDSLRWLRGEFSTRTDARRALGVRAHIDDAAVCGQIKLLSAFVRLAGYSGLLVCLDEAVNMFKIVDPRARSANYETLLATLNDSLQGNAPGLGFLLCTTPEALMDPRRGIYSYQALQTRLAENRFATDGLVDHDGPVLHLKNLTREDLLVLIGNIRNVHASGDESNWIVPDEALREFIEESERQIGAATFLTPRDTIRAFVGFIRVLEQNPGTTWQALLNRTKFEPEPGRTDTPAADDELNREKGNSAPAEDEKADGDGLMPAVI